MVTISHYETPLHLAKAYNGWVNRKLIGFYERFVRTIFQRYRDKVKLWLTFNEINSVLHEPFSSGGIYTDKAKSSAPRTSIRRSTTSWWPALWPPSWPMR